MWQKETKITEFRDVVSKIRDSGFKIRDVREVGFACGKKKQKTPYVARRCLKNSRSTRRACTFSCTTMSIANFNGIASKALRYAQSY